eukprot:7378053-Prymnesium_polylepis.2
MPHAARHQGVEPPDDRLGVQRAPLRVRDRPLAARARRAVDAVAHDEDTIRVGRAHWFEDPRGRKRGREREELLRGAEHGDQPRLPAHVRADRFGETFDESPLPQLIERVERGERVGGRGDETAMLVACGRAALVASAPPMLADLSGAAREPARLAGVGDEGGEDDGGDGGGDGAAEVGLREGGGGGSPWGASTSLEHTASRVEPPLHQPYPRPLDERLKAKADTPQQQQVGGHERARRVRRGAERTRDELSDRLLQRVDGVGWRGEGDDRFGREQPHDGAVSARRCREAEGAEYAGGARVEVRVAVRARQRRLGGWECEVQQQP